MIKERFPYASIGDNERYSLSQMWGLPDPKGEALERFIEGFGKPMIQDGALVGTLHLAAVSWAEKLGGRTEKRRLSFMRGAYLYAGVLSVASWFHKVPVDEVVLTDLQNGDSDYLALDLLSKLNEARSFCEIAEPVWPALGADTHQRKQLALLGAGFIHAVTTKADQASRDIAKVEAAFSYDEAVLLEEAFKKIEEEF